MCGLKESDQSRITPRQRTWGLEEMVVLPIDSETVGGEDMRAGGKMISSVLDMLSLRKRWDIQDEIAERQAEI